MVRYAIYTKDHRPIGDFESYRAAYSYGEQLIGDREWWYVNVRK